MNAQVQIIPLTAISLWNNHRGEVDPSSLSELSESIKQKGLLQPVIVRTVTDKKQPYQLIAGFRRYAAMSLAEGTEILCNVLTLNDDEAFDVQMTENLQREDISPMDEAVAFRQMLDSGRYTMADVCSKIAKSEGYVTHRLKLIDLIKPLQLQLKKGDLPIGHAMELAKLSAEDQEEIRNDMQLNGWPVLSDLKSDIERNYMGNLSAAPWKKDDAMLVPSAGACNVCPKRSGANPSLFPDIKQKDRCSDRACYQRKASTFIELKVIDVLEKQPETVFLREKYGSDPAPKLLKTLKDNGVKPLVRWDDFNEATKGKGKLVGIWLNGEHAGKSQEINLKSASGQKSTTTTKAAGKESSEIDYQLAIEGIKTRTSRSNELESQRTHKLVEDLMYECEAMKTNPSPLTNREMVAAVTMFYEDCEDYDCKVLIDKAVAIKSGKDVGISLFKKLSGMEATKLEAIFWQCVRIEMIHRLRKGSEKSPEKDNEAAVIESLAFYYIPQKIAALYVSKKEANFKRTTSAEKRIGELKKKQAAEKKATPKSAAKPKKK